MAVDGMADEEEVNVIKKIAKMLDLEMFEVVMWTATYEVVLDGKFGKDEQKFFSERFGQEKLEKMIRFQSGMRKMKLSELYLTSLKMQGVLWKSWYLPSLDSKGLIEKTLGTSATSFLFPDL